jgi:hypothetical protein
MLGPLAILAGAACLATPVHGNEIRIGPISGGIVPGFDDIGGRFTLRAGGMRTETLSQKILWTVPRTYTVGPYLEVRGLRLDRPRKRFTQRFPGAASPADPRSVYFFPSNLDPPTAGCWRLTFRTGPIVATATARVLPAVSPR